MSSVAYFRLAVIAASAVCHLQSVAPVFSFPILRDFSEGRWSAGFDGPNPFSYRQLVMVGYSVS